MIHIKRTKAFGDVLWTEPIVRHFINKKLRVNILTDYPEAFENYPSKKLSVNKKDFIGKLLKLDRHFIDLDMAYENNPKIHILEAYRNVAGIPEMELTYPQIHLREMEKKPRIKEEYVILHIEKNPLNHRNIYAINWKSIVSYFEQKGFKVVQISKTPSDLYGQWIKTKDFREIMSLIYPCRLFIGLDSGPSHVAASFGIPSIIFFGAVNPVFRQLKSFNGICLQEPCEYANCYHENQRYTKVCKLFGENGTPKCCIQNEQKVMQAIDKYL